MSFTSRFLRKTFGRSRSQCARASSTAVTPFKNSIYIRFIAIGNDLTDKWLARLKATSHTFRSTEHFSQLSAVIDLFNKAPKATTLKVSELSTLS